MMTFLWLLILVVAAVICFGIALNSVLSHDNSAVKAAQRVIPVKYRCPECKKVVDRASEKAWVKSYCEEAGRTVRLQRVVPPKSKTKRNLAIPTV